MIIKTSIFLVALFLSAGVYSNTNNSYQISVQCDAWIGASDVFVAASKTDKLAKWFQQKELCPSNSAYPRNVSREQACELKKVSPVADQIVITPSVKC